jgi:hypothetical protein
METLLRLLERNRKTISLLSVNGSFGAEHYAHKMQAELARQLAAAAEKEAEHLAAELNNRRGY